MTPSTQTPPRRLDDYQKSRSFVVRWVPCLTNSLSYCSTGRVAQETLQTTTRSPPRQILPGSFLVLRRSPPWVLLLLRSTPQRPWGRKQRT